MRRVAAKFFGPSAQIRGKRFSGFQVLLNGENDFGD